jgi:glycosyltransferase involved in cell wall biosynthesis
VKILHVFKDYYPPTHGGIEKHIHDIVHSLAGFEFTVLTAARARTASEAVEDGVRVIRAAEYGRISTSPVTPSWWRRLRESDADLVHFHMPNPFGELAFLTAATDLPLVVTYHADIVGRWGLRPVIAPLQQLFLARAARIVVASPPVYERTSALRAHRRRAVVIPFGVDLESWGPRPELADEIRRRHPGPLVLYLGRLVPYKGVEVLVEAMREVDATLIVAGDGPRRGAIAAAARGAAVESRVVLTGAIPDEERAAYYHAADVFCLPSVTRAESFGISTLEAMASGTAAVTTELGTGTSFVNVDRDTGRVVRPRDPGALAAALRAVLRDDTARTAMGEAARERVRARFTRTAMLERLAEVYASVRRA